MLYEYRVTFNHAYYPFSKNLTISNILFRREELDDLGIHYDNRVLAFKLLKSLNLSTEALLAVFAGLKLDSQDLLQLTLDCLTGIVGGKNSLKTFPYKLTMEETQVGILLMLLMLSSLFIYSFFYYYDCFYYYYYYH